MKRIILTMGILFPCFIFAQESYTIKGKVGVFNTPAKVYMQYADNGERKLDSADIKNGEFTFNGLVKSPTVSYIVLSEEGKSLEELSNPDMNKLYLSSGTINVEGTSLKDAKIFGNKINEEYSLYKSLTKELDASMEAINVEYTEAPDDKKKDETFIASLSEKASIIYEKLENVKSDYIKNNKNVIVLNLIQQSLSPENLLEYEGYFKSFPADLQSSSNGVAVANKIETLRSVAVGSVAPNFTLPDVNGKDISLSSFKGKYVLIDFWASWCSPCRQENPHVVAAYNKFKDKGFTILGVSLDQPGKKDAWLKAIDEDQLGQWTQVSDLTGWKSPVVALYSVTGIPQNFLLDKDGKIIASNLRGQALEDKLQEILN